MWTSWSPAFKAQIIHVTVSSAKCPRLSLSSRMDDLLSGLQGELSFVGCFFERRKQWNRTLLVARSISACACNDTIWLMRTWGSLLAVHFVSQPVMMKSLFQLTSWNGGEIFFPSLRGWRMATLYFQRKSTSPDIARTGMNTRGLYLGYLITVPFDFHYLISYKTRRVFQGRLRYSNAPGSQTAFLAFFISLFW